MKSRFGIIVLAAVAAGSLAASACKDLDPFDPCPETKVQEKAGQLDGTWDVEIVKDVTGTHGLPYKPLKLVGTPELIEGSLVFQTTSATKGKSCTDLLKTEGIAIANYKYNLGGLNSDTTDWYSGRFVMDHTTGELTLRGGKYTRRVDVANSGGDRLIIASVSGKEFKKQYEPLGTITVIFEKRPF